MDRLPALGFRFPEASRQSRVRTSEVGAKDSQGSRIAEAGSRASDPLGLRPKSITPVLTSTSGAGKGDAIIASPKAFFARRADFFAQKASSDLVSWTGL